MKKVSIFCVLKVWTAQQVNKSLKTMKFADMYLGCHNLYAYTKSPSLWRVLLAPSPVYYANWLSSIPLAVAFSPSGMASLWNADGDRQTGKLIGWPWMVVERSRMDTSRRILGRRRYLNSGEEKKRRNESDGSSDYFGHILHLIRALYGKSNELFVLGRRNR